MKRKLILFDIDGTLILTGGIAAGLMAESVSRVLKRPVHWTINDFVGNTDRNIIAKLLLRSGTSESFVEEYTDRALKNYLKDLLNEIGKDDLVTILPGVPELLKKLRNDDRFALGLLTGNVRAGSQIKLRKGNLIEYFPVGAFGDDAMMRDELPSFVLPRAEKYYNCFFEREDVWIVGDSINDIKCAHANRLKSLAVTTGHQGPDELLAYRPTHLIADLSDTENIMQILLD